MAEVKKIRTACRSCHGGCGVIAHVKDGKVMKVEGDPESPISHGTLCSKGLAITQLVYHPDRVLYPMKKTDKGWNRISWDSALDTIAEKFKVVIERHGPEAIVIGQGTGRDYESFLYRFANLLGTPNVLTAGHMCYVSRVGATLITCGNLPVCDYEGEPKCIVVWGCNSLWTNPDEYKAEGFWRAYKKGAKLIVIDPRRGFLASKADLWLQLRPGTDAALAMGFHNVIIEEGLYDTEFVGKYIHGWDGFVERVKKYPPEHVEDITWVQRDLIREAARMYATTSPACIQWGVPVEQSINCTDCNRLLTGLMAATGNLDAPGGNVFFVPPPVRTVSEFSRHKDLSLEQRKKRLGGEQYRLASRVALISPKSAWDSILSGKPYQLKAALLCGSNPVLTRANAREVYQALQEIEFLTVIDFFLTPTGELADIFLPAATWLEQNYVGDFWKRHGYVVARQKAVEVGECWQDHKIFQELGKRMGQEKYWWDTLEQALDYMLEPSGLTWDEFKERGYLKGKMRYRKYQEKGFSTPTGKVELHSTTLEKWGHDPLPQYREVPESPVSKPELLGRYPYVLNVGLRTPTFFHSANRMIPWLREIRPDPIVEIHPETAKKHGIEAGQWVRIESPRGHIRQRAKLNHGIDPRVIVAEHGWWFPELKDPGHGWDISNVNVLTDNDPEISDPVMGSTNLRALLCNISPCDDPEEETRWEESP
ncbi:MAG: molybdopterin-dependent oxidoreductase [Deltaproteobacteria bacterium]|nr:MAG: molybdopterin-dependent oxidoreductase [Deltaproteobacteria bacterium]